MFLFRPRRPRLTPEVKGPQRVAKSMLESQRSYLSDAPYLLPKDHEEDERLNFQHHALYRTIGNHYLAPLSTVKTILDVGTGTGIWPVEMAKLFPQAHIIGVDVSHKSLQQPLPEPCLFCTANVLHGLPFPDCQFDFVHQR